MPTLGISIISPDFCGRHHAGRLPSGSSRLWSCRFVATMLGHADPGFTLRTYVHLMDAGVGDAEFFDDAVGNDDEV